MGKKVTLLLVALNEVEGLKATFDQIPKDCLHQIIALDGGSTDGSIDFYKENNIEYYVQKERGIRSGYQEIWPQLTGDYIITFSPDGNCIPELIPSIIAELGRGNDMVICSRYKDDATSEDDDIVTGFGNWLFTGTVNFFFGAKYTDVMGIYRGFRKDLIDELDLKNPENYKFFEKILFTKISWEPLLSARAARLNKKISEVPGDEPARLGGERKLQIIRWGAAYYLQFLKEKFLINQGVIRNEISKPTP